MMKAIKLDFYKLSVTRAMKVFWIYAMFLDCLFKGFWRAMFLDWLPGAEGGSLHEDPGGEGDELLRGAALEETDRREIVACLRIIIGNQ